MLEIQRSRARAGLSSHEIQEAELEGVCLDQEKKYRKGIGKGRSPNVHYRLGHRIFNLPKPIKRNQDAFRSGKKILERHRKGKTSRRAID